MNRIDFIQEIACERITEILNVLNIEYTLNADSIHFACPIHDGDNDRALWWAIQTNHWRCFTNHCEKTDTTGNSNSVFGLVRGIMSTRTSRQWSFIQSVNFISKILNIETNHTNKQTGEDIEISSVIKKYKARIKKNKTNTPKILLNNVIKRLTRDTVYYPNRNINKETISKYNISFCDKSNKPFFNRSFFPTLDITGKYIVGWSARSIYKKCELCSLYHDPKYKECPPDNKKHIYTKWKHSRNFQSGKCLYNIWYAKKQIEKTGVAIICEGPGDCWAYDQAGIQNSVSMFGLNLSKYQRHILQKVGALTLILTLDNDNKGIEATEKLSKELGQYFQVFSIKPKSKDIGEMNTEDIRELVCPLLQKQSLCGALE